jgi:hypothetical protein
MRYGEQVLLAVVNVYVRIKIPVAKFDANHSRRWQHADRCFNPEAA